MIFVYTIFGCTAGLALGVGLFLAFGSLGTAILCYLVGGATGLILGGMRMLFTPRAGRGRTRLDFNRRTA